VVEVDEPAVRDNGFLATMPAQLSFEEATPSTEGSHYALALLRKAKVGTSMWSWSRAWAPTGPAPRPQPSQL
jgi:hypothetical protein